MIAKSKVAPVASPASAVPAPALALLELPKGCFVLKPQEAAARLGCDVGHIYDLIEEGKIRALNISGAGNLTDRRALRIPVESWRRFVLGNLA